MRKEILYRLLKLYGWKRLSKVKQLIFLDESYKHTVNTSYYISALLIQSRMYYLEEFNGIVKKFKNKLNNVKELKFSFIFTSSELIFKRLNYLS